MKIKMSILLVLITGVLLRASDKPPLQRLTIFFTNDMHGGIVEQKADFLNPEFPPMLGGGASAAVLIQKVRKEARQSGSAVLVIDAGDIFQGTLVGTLSKGKAVVEFMNMMKYDATVPGNHDFDLGKETLIELIKMSDFPWISANIYDARTGKHWEWVKPWILIEKNGIRLGLTGATTTGTERMSFPEHIKGLEFRPEIPSLQTAVDSLKALGADLVVAMVHAGLPYDPKEGYAALKQETRQSVLQKGYVNAMEIAHFVEGIDVLLGGHLHKGYDKPWEDPVNHTICLQNYGNFGNLGWIDLYLDRPTRSIVSYDYPADSGTLLLLQEDEFWPDSLVLAYIKMQQRIYEKGFEEVIGETLQTLVRSGIGEAPLNNLILDAIRDRVGADFAFSNFGGIRSDLKKGPITRSDIFKVLPFGNQIVVFQVSGRFLKKIVEQKLRGGGRGLAISGGKVVFNKNLPDGNRIVYMEIGGKPLEPDVLYRVATSDYLMEGNSGLSLLKEIPSEQTAFTGILMREAVMEYIKAHSPLEIHLDGRWKKDDKAQPLPEFLEKFSRR